MVIAGLCLALVAGIHVHKAVAVDTDGGQGTSDTGSDDTGSDDTDDPGVTGDTDEPGDEDMTPSYANPAQAQHAANLAAAVASQSDENTEGALSDVEQAEADLAEAEKNGNQEDIDAAEEKLAEAQEAYADVISEKSGVVSAEIVDMRNAGMGWGQIAHELGVHPGLLGLGHTKKKHGSYAQQGVDTTVGEVDMDEVTEATERNTRSGWSKGHGVDLNAGVGSTGKTRGGSAFGHANKGTKGGISGASGLSGGKGGGKGGGNSGKGKGVGSSGGPGNGKGVAGTDGSPGNSGKGNSKGGNSDKGSNKGGNSGNGKGGGKGK